MNHKNKGIELYEKIQLLRSMAKKRRLKSLTDLYKFDPNLQTLKDYCRSCGYTQAEVDLCLEESFSLLRGAGVVE